MKLYRYKVTIVSKVGAYGVSPVISHSGIVLAEYANLAEQKVREEYDGDSVLALNIAIQETDMIELE